MRILAFLAAMSACCGQTNLRQYLALTSQQLKSIQQLNSDYAAYLDKQDQQLAAINGQISGLYLGAAPDPMALGNLYVQSEMIRRDIAAHRSALETQAAAQLTDTQAGLVQQLGDSIVLQPLGADAQCAFLVQPSAYLQGVLTSARRVGDLADFLLGNTLPLVPPAPSGTFCGSSVFPISIREYLGITDAQVAVLATESAAYNDYYAKQQDQMNDLYVNIRDETAKASPDPAALGFFYWQLAALGKAISQEQADLQQQAQAVLSDAQKAALKKLQDAVALEPVAEMAERCALLVQPPGTGTAPGVLISARASLCQL